MKWSMASLAAAVLLPLADLPAFRDLFEPRTLRDRVVRAASALAVAALVGASARMSRTDSGRG